MIGKVINLFNVVKTHLSAVLLETYGLTFAEMSLGGAVKFVSAELIKQIGLWLSTPIGMISAIALGIFAVVKVTDALTTSAAEARENLGQIASDYQSNENEIKTLNDELTTTRDRINELKSKGTLSFTEASELTELQRQNAALERKIELLEIANKKAQKDAQNDFNTAAGETVSVMGAGYVNEIILTTTGLSNSPTEDYLDSAAETVQKYVGILQDLEDSGVTYANANEETKKNIDLINKLIDTYMVASGETDTLFASIYNRDKYAEARTAIEDLAEAGNLTAESLQNLYNQGGNVKEFIDYMLSLNTVDWETMLGDDFDRVADEDGIVSLDKALKAMSGDTELASKIMSLFANELNKVEETAEDAETSFKSIAQTLSDGLDKLSNKKDILSEVKEQLDSFGAISADNISKILEQFTDDDGVQEAVAYYLSGIGTAQQVYDAMAKGYQDSLKLQAETLAEQMKNNEKYYEAIGGLDKSFTDWLSSNYSVDLQNCTTLAKTKLEVENSLINTFKENWGKYYKWANNISSANINSEIERIEKLFPKGYTNPLLSDKGRANIVKNDPLAKLFGVDHYQRLYTAWSQLKNIANGNNSATKELEKLISKNFNTTGFKTSLSTDFDKSNSQSGKTEAEKYFERLKYQLDTNQITQEQYLKSLDSAYKRFYNKTADYLEDYAKYSQEVYDGFKDMYKEDLEAQKEAWEEKKDAVSEYYDNLREQIEDAHDEEDYEKEQSEKRKEIFDLDMQIAELMRDGSEKAKARIAELEEERLKAEEELLDFETDKAREDELSRLEKEQKAEEDKIQQQIDKIDGDLKSIDENITKARQDIINYAKAKGVILDFAHASGTRSSPGGFGRINEKGIEMISAPDGNGNYIPMLPNSYVFSAKATEFLWKLATEHSLPQAMYNIIAKTNKTQSNTPSVNIAQPITITMGDVIIKGNADKQTVADIKRQQDNTVRMVLQRIKELQK